MIGRTIALAFLLAASSPAAAADSLTPSLPEQAVRAIDADDWPAAVKHLADPAKEPGNAAANYWLGFAQSMQKDRAAKDSLAAALKADATSVAAARMLARCGEDFARDAKMPDFVTQVADAFTFDGDVQHHVGRAWAQRYLHQVRSRATVSTEDLSLCRRKGIEHLRQAALLGTSEASNDRWLALLLLRDEQYAEAGTAARRAMDAGDSGYEIRLLLAAALTHLGQPAEADRAYEEARRQAPARTGLVEFERGKALLVMRRYNEAVEAMRAVLHMDSAQYNVRHYMGLAALGGRNYPFALWAFQQSAAVDGRADDLYGQGRCAYAMGCPKDAERLFRQAMAKYGESRKDVTPPAEWVHYLGRAQWRQDNRQEALANLKAAFDRAPDQPLYARWLYQCQLAADDVHAAIETCRVYGNRGHADAALEAVQGILARWPTPRPQDALAKRLPHMMVAWAVLGDLYGSQGRHRTAVHYYRMAMRTSGRLARIQAGWALVRCGNWTEAEQTFRDYIQYQDEKNKDYGRLGLGCVLLAKGSAAEARDVLAAMKPEFSPPARETALFWAALRAGDPKARSGADPYTALGMIYNNRLGAGRGELVMMVVPGSPLDSVKPRLLPGDVVLRVGGRPLGSPEQLADLRKGRLAEGPVEVLVRRKSVEFAVEPDLAPLVKSLPAGTGPPAAPAASAPRPGGQKEAGP